MCPRRTVRDWVLLKVPLVLVVCALRGLVDAAGSVAVGVAVRRLEVICARRVRSWGEMVGGNAVGAPIGRSPALVVGEAAA